jgi:hypothetical protein
MTKSKTTQMSDGVSDRFAVLLDVGCDWPEVIFVGDHASALLIAQVIPDEIGVSVQAVIVPDEAIVENAETIRFDR